MGRGTVVRAGEAAYTTGDWWLGSWKRGGPRKARTSKSGGRVVRAWKSVAGELVVPGKARAWRSNSTVSLEKRGCGGEGLTTTGDMMRAGDWRQGTGDKSERKQEQETAGSGRRSRRQRQPNGSGVLFFFAV